MKTKQSQHFCQLELKDLDDSKGIVTFYYSQFDTKDQNGDIVLDSAFKKTVSERKEKIYHNIQHTDRVVGNPFEFGQDSNGAWTRSQLALKTVDGNDAFEKYRAKMIKGHSIEFNTMKSSLDESKKARLVAEVLLWGVTSITTVPANYGATTISLKGLDDLAGQMKDMNDFLRTANISDKCGEEILVEYKRLQDFFFEQKIQLFKDAGIVHCEKCMKVYDSGKEKKCPNCGQYVNKSSDEVLDMKVLTDMLKAKT